MKILWLPSFLILAAVSAQAAETKPTAKRDASDDAKSQLVCVTEPVVGSHIKKRICMTQEEREQRRKADQEAMIKAKSTKGGAYGKSKD